MQTAADAAGVDLNLDVNLPTVDEVACKLEEEGAAGRDDAREEVEDEEEADDATGRVELAVVRGKAPWADRRMDDSGDKGVKGKSKGKSKGNASKGGQIRLREDGGLARFSCAGCFIK